MIIKSFELKKLDKSNINLILLYGENEGFKHSIIKDFFIKEFKGEIQRYEEDDVFTNYNEFISNLLNKSFFNDKKILILSRTSEKILKLVEEIITKDLSDVKIIINSKSLDKKSKLRSFFEKKDKCACIPFYEDDERTLNQMASSFFIKNKINISREMLNLIVDRCRGDRQNLNNELEKISSLISTKRNISTDDVIKLTNLAENYSISELIDNCLAKNTNKVNKILNENKFSGDECILILRTLLFKTKRLLELSKKNLDIKNIDKTISSFKPPIFWKDKQIVKNQIMNWRVNEVENLILSIKNKEIDVKKHASNSLYLVLDFILTTAAKTNS
tara:strand:- start:158 stop:1153 length:996 start_codon:yes stop_codon:yes gene_type:complete